MECLQRSQAAAIVFIVLVSNFKPNGFCLLECPCHTLIREDGRLHSVKEWAPVFR